jgi:hypothetical protein
MSGTVWKVWTPSKCKLFSWLIIQNRVWTTECLKLGGIADFLNYGGKLQLVKSVLASMPIFFMCCFDVPVTIKDQVVKYMRHCLWRKKKIDVQANGTALVAWKKNCRPKERGGLGVLNLEVQNKALMLKNLQKKIQQP